MIQAVGALLKSQISQKVSMGGDGHLPASSAGKVRGGIAAIQGVSPGATAGRPVAECGDPRPPPHGPKGIAGGWNGSSCVILDKPRFCKTFKVGLPIGWRRGPHAKQGGGASSAGGSGLNVDFSRRKVSLPLYRPGGHHFGRPRGARNYRRGFFANVFLPLFWASWFSCVGIRGSERLSRGRAAKAPARLLEFYPTGGELKRGLPMFHGPGVSCCTTRAGPQVSECSYRSQLANPGFLSSIPTAAARKIKFLVTGITFRGERAGTRSPGGGAMPASASVKRGRNAPRPHQNTGLRLPALRSACIASTKAYNFWVRSKGTLIAPKG